VFLGLQYVAQRSKALHDHGSVVRIRRSLQVIHVALRRGARLAEPLSHFAKATIRRREIGGERSGSHICIAGFREMLCHRRFAFRSLEQRALAFLARLEHSLIRVAALLPVAQVAFVELRTSPHRGPGVAYEREQLGLGGISSCEIFR